MSHAASRSGKVGWLQAWSGRYLRAPSVIILIAANLIPLYGVLHWGWDLYVLMTVYWMETGIIGFWTAVRMAMVARWAAIILVPFFIIHFGGFMAGHFLFLWVLFAGDWSQQVAGAGDFLRVIVFGTGLWLAFIALFCSHGGSFYLNVLRPMLRVRRHAAAGRHANAPDPSAAEALEPQQIMMTPYGRIVVMHATILGGAFLIQTFQTKLAAFVLLIALKVVFDVVAHVRKNFAPAGLARR
jgi:hypothetical protein